MMIAANKGEGSIPGFVPDPPTYQACVAHLQTSRNETASTLKQACQEDYEQLDKKVLPKLLNDYWVLGEASKQGLKFSEAEARKRLSSEAAQQHFLHQERETMSDLIFNERVNMLWSKLVANAEKTVSTTPSESNISLYGQQHVPELERRNVLLAASRTPRKAKKAKAEIQAGASFASVAERTPVGRAWGSSKFYVLRSELLTEEAGRTLFGAKPNVLSGPTKIAPETYLVYEVKNAIPASQQPAAQLRSTIVKLITASQQQKAVAEFIHNFHQKWMALTECHAEYLVAQCKREQRESEEGR
jgi:DNA primase